MEAIGKKIKRLRNIKRISLKELASILGVSDTALSKIETGKTQSITIDLGKGIASTLEVSFNELFEIEPPQINTEEIEQLKRRVKELEETLRAHQITIELQNKNLNYAKFIVMSMLIGDDDLAIVEYEKAFGKNPEDVSLGVIIAIDKIEKRLGHLINTGTLTKEDFEFFVKDYVKSEELKSELLKLL
jgi:transcriptional regulator with XRE-family HTH domain